jgi:16S rRNA (uracil1498-N3)-methyltransferase
MRLHRFYLSTPITEETFDVTDKDLLHQWRNVFRYNVGSQVIIFDGSGYEFLCIISSLRSLGASLSVLQKKKVEDHFGRDIWLCVGIIKKDFELIVQKATELGVSHIVPLLCKRSEKKDVNLERLRKIAIESGEQSGRGEVPMIHGVISLEDVLKSSILPEEKIFLHPEGKYIGDFLNTKNSKHLAIFIGPEGGFTPAEIEDFSLYKIPEVSLGPQILRTETAAIAVSCLLLL